MLQQVVGWSVYRVNIIHVEIPLPVPEKKKKLSKSLKDGIREH